MSASPLLSIRHLLQEYRAGHRTPAAVLADIRERAARHEADNIWIHLLTEAETAPWLEALAGQDPATLPLYGIPFAIKDNIDLAGIPTTAGCAAFSYTPDSSAFVVQRLIAAGALPVGKTNLDQFATGLVGTRSPWGPTRNAFDPDTISGGSSSGSAVAVTRGLASFSLGTDTAGSGRVPAAFNNLVGIKPSSGLLSTRGVVPACRSLDCVSVFALDCADATSVMEVVTAYDEGDPYAREAHGQPAASRAFRFGVPEDRQLEFFGDREAESLFLQTVDRLCELGGEPVSVDFQPFLDTARLLYEGPWVAERYAAIESFIASSPDEMLPVTRSIIEPGGALRSVDAFRAQYRLQALRRQADMVWNRVEFMLTPTAGTIYSIAAVNSDPIALNSNLGYYTNFMNLLDYAAVAVPAGRYDRGLPFGVTLFAPAFHDAALMQYAARLHHTGRLMLGGTTQPVPAPPETGEYADDTVRLIVCGAHMQGLPLNHQLTELGARLVDTTHTAPRYRLYALAGGPPFRPGLVRDETHGSAIEVEVWELSSARLGSFMSGIPAPLGIGTVELASGNWCKGFICESCAIETAREITDFGGWRGFLASEDA